MTRTTRIPLTGLLAALLCGAAVARQGTQAPLEQRFDPTQDIGIDQRLGERVPLELIFRDEDGREVRLGDYFGERPVVVALVYYECPMLCTLVLNGMVRSFRALSLDIGEDFEIVTVSIDPTETPELALSKKEGYLASYVEGAERPGAAAGWHFLTGEQQAIDALAEAVGFRYVYDEEAGEYAHASGIMVATSEGVLSRYLYGIEYITRDLRLALVEASQGQVGSFVDQVLLLCYHYDPTTGRYGFAIMAALRTGGIATVGLIVGFVLLSLRRERRARRAQRAAASGS